MKAMNMTEDKDTLLRVLGIKMPPHSDLAGYDKHGEPVLGGIGYRIIDAILSSLEIKHSPMFFQGFTGVPLGNGSWNGALGVLQRNEADIAIACHIPSFERSQVVDLSFITAQGDSFIYGAVGPAESTDIGSILKIFSPMVWFGIISSMLLLATVQGLTLETENDVLVIKFLKMKEFHNILSSYIAALFFEGTPRDPVTARGRLLYGIWWLSLVVLVNGFCGHTRAMMMAPKENFKVRDLEHLVSVTDRITPMTLKDSIFESFFKGGSPTEKRIFKSLNLNVGIKEMFSMEKLMLLKKGKGVILFESIISRNRIGTRCEELGLNIYSSGKPFLSSYCYMAFSKEMNQSIRKRIDRRIRWLFEGDLINKWIKTECRLFERCSFGSLQDDSEKALTLKDLSDLFVFVCICLGIAFICFLVELLADVPFGKGQKDVSKPLYVHKENIE